jgi:hypothetical protein
MSIFGSIVSAIFGHASAPAAAAPTPAAPTAPSAAAPGGYAGAAAAQPMSRADVVAMIEKAAGAQSENLNWKQSIVDLMKALKLDSSLAARKQLAQELGYTGPRWLGGDEHLAAQAGHGETGGRRRQGAGQPQDRLSDQGRPQRLQRQSSSLQSGPRPLGRSRQQTLRPPHFHSQLQMLRQ